MFECPIWLTNARQAVTVHHHYSVSKHCRKLSVSNYISLWIRPYDYDFAFEMNYLTQIRSHVRARIYDAGKCNRRSGDEEWREENAKDGTSEDVRKCVRACKSVLRVETLQATHRYRVSLRSPLSLPLCVCRRSCCCKRYLAFAFHVMHWIGLAKMS